jgi:hypothetical protein
MQLPVIVEHLGDDHFRAEAAVPFSVSAEGKSSQEAVQNLRTRIESEFSNGRQLMMLEVNVPHEHAWMKYVGHLKDDPLFDEWQAAIREYRRQRDVEDGIETDERT